MDLDWLDDDGYPSEAALERIEKWNWKEGGLRPWFEFVKSLWRYPFYWTEVEDCERAERRYEISTAGWSGNESLIAAMEANHMMHSLTWLSSRRGGHYEFFVTDKQAAMFPGKEAGA